MLEIMTLATQVFIGKGALPARAMAVALASPEDLYVLLDVKPDYLGILGFLFYGPLGGIAIAGGNAVAEAAEIKRIQESSPELIKSVGDIQPDVSTNAEWPRKATDKTRILVIPRSKAETVKFNLRGRLVISTGDVHISLGVSMFRKKLVTRFLKRHHWLY